MDHNLPPSTGDPSTTQTTTTKSTYSASQPRRFDWVFRALHSVASRRSNSITLSLPSTVIFATGSPVKWLTTLQDGRVAREMLNAGDNYQSSMRHVRSKAKNNSEINVQEQIKQVRKPHTHTDGATHTHTLMASHTHTDGPKASGVCSSLLETCTTHFLFTLRVWLTVWLAVHACIWLVHACCMLHAALHEYDFSHAYNFIGRSTRTSTPSAASTPTSPTTP